ncbi:MAG: hypothetical protein WC796_03295 [Candidatus Pacearchaeota archaeon]|jgi:hypothetical protein
MPLLKEVKHCESGLVGITESGDEVRLSVPIPKVWGVPSNLINDRESTEQSTWLDRVVNALTAYAGNSLIYLSAREVRAHDGGLGLFYLEYKLRE